MPVPTDITAGTISISGSTVTGVGTSFEASDIRQGDLFIWIEGGAGQWSPIVQTVTSNTVLTLAEPWTGPTISGARYRLRYQWDSSRVSAQSRQLIEMLDNGNILALAGLTGPGVPVFDGPHSMTIRPETDFINGVAYNVQVDTLADRAAYDGQAAGYSVLVSDVGDGRSAVYSKASNASGDWTDPAYITGPIGGTPDIAAGTTTTLPPGSDATFTVGPDGSGGYLLNTGIPAGRGFTNRGAYDSGEDYVIDDVVTFAGSTFIAIQAVPSGNPPSSAMPPVDNTYWAVLAARGANGAGTVSNVAAGSGIAVDPTDPTAPVVALGNVPTATIKGRVVAGTGTPTDLTGTQVNTILPVFGTAKGLVPGRTSADVTANRLLQADGTWVDPPASGGGTSAFQLPVGTNAQRPTTPVLGMVRFNSTYGVAEIYENAEWRRLETTNLPYDISYLVVAGGGGGGASQGAGGGAGGVLSGTITVTPGNAKIITIGGGGAGGGTGGRGSNGSNSSISSDVVAIGGGGGANGGSTVGGNGGSGGGSTGGSAGGAGTSGQGNAGGGGVTNATGGGGGAGSAGGTGVTGSAGNGGNGISSSISGTSQSYGGGGAGFGSGTTTGGTGGGGNTSTNGQVNSGGGGGAWNGTGSAGNGGSGIIIISYPGAQKGSGGVVTSAGGNTIHTFTASGSFTP